MSDWAHGVSGWARRAMCRWCCVGIAPVVLVWRDVSYSGALYEGKRFVYPLAF